MNQRDIVGYLVGGAFVYGLAAACSGLNGGSTTTSTAGADNSGLNISTETCVSAPTDSCVTGFAAHDYPGKTIDELSALRILVPKSTIDGMYTHDVHTGQDFSVGPGRVKLCCAAGQSVTFVLPN